MPLEILADHPTWWDEGGLGVRRALFIHAFLTHSGAWKAVQAQLDKKLKMRGFDMPGHGRSGDWDPQKTGQSDFQTSVARIANKLIDKRADVIGHSFGATVALRMARDFPDKVRSVTLIEPVLFEPLREQEVYQAHMQEMADFDTALKAGDHDVAAREFDAVWGPGVPWPDIPENLRKSLIKRIPMIAEGADVTLHDRHRQTVPGALEAIRQPVLLMEGALSPPIIHASHDLLAARLPNARRVMVAGAGHMLPMSHPEAVAGEIAAFLKV